MLRARAGLADKLKEVLLHATIYYGIPAANSAFRMAKEVIA